VLCAALVALPAGCGPAEEPPAKAVAPDSRQIDAAMRAIEAYMAADKPSEAGFVAEKLAADVPGLMRAHEIHGRALVALAMRPDLPSEDRAAVFARAADAYMRAAALAPTNGPLQHATGVVCDTAGRHEDAVRAYEAAHADEPTNAQFALYLGMARALGTATNCSKAAMMVNAHRFLSAFRRPVSGSMVSVTIATRCERPALILRVRMPRVHAVSFHRCEPRSACPR
jgi:tetratricopeptide (TPR) repeat protein